MQTTYDDAGRKTEEYYTDSKGDLVDSEKDYVKMPHAYDEATGLETEACYYNAADNPVMVKGVAHMDYEYDAAGNKNVTCNYDIEDNLVLENDGVAYTQLEYDDWKRVVRETFIGEDGQPLFVESKGYAVTTKGYASMASAYAEDGTQTDTYYDAEGNEVYVEQ